MFHGNFFFSLPFFLFSPLAGFSSLVGVGQALGTERCVATRIGLLPGSVPGRREEGRERDAGEMRLCDLEGLDALAGQAVFRHRPIISSGEGGCLSHFHNQGFRRSPNRRALRCEARGARSPSVLVADDLQRMHAGWLAGDEILG